MNNNQLKFENRTLIGSIVRKLRKQGLLPAVVYGNKLENLNITVNYLETLKLYKKVGTTSVIELVSTDSKKINCLIHDFDLDPVRNELRHVDFLRVDLKKKTEATVPLLFVNTPSKDSDGILVKNITEVEIKALPNDIPHEIEVDLSKLVNIGDVITVENLPMGKKYEIITDNDLVIASLVEEEKEVIENENLDTNTETTASEDKNSTVDKVKSK